MRSTDTSKFPSIRLFNIVGQTAIVTGGASGLGLAITEVLAQQGAHVLMLDMNEEALRLQEERLRALGLQVEGGVLDVTDQPAMDAAFDRFASKQGRLDIVFANAGIDPGPGFTNFANRSERLAGHAIESYDRARWQRVIDISLNAVLYSIQASVRHMKPRGRGRIVVTTSTAALRVSPAVGAAYMAAKAGAAHLVRTTALELARYGILVNAIAPGPFVTNINDGRMKQPEVQSALAGIIPVHRVGQPTEIHGIALLLASEAGSFITGQQIVVDGGYTLGAVD